MQKKILYLDMDGVVADFGKGIKQIIPDLEVGDNHPNSEERSLLIDKVMQENPRIFLNLDPIEGAIESAIQLSEWYDVYFLSTPAWHVPESFMDKRLWIERHFGKLAERRLILSHVKNLSIGHYLVDDRTHNGAGEFSGVHIHFGTNNFPDWGQTFHFLKRKHEIDLQLNLK